MKNLSHHDIHAIFTQISNTLNCPECKSQIMPHQIKIMDMVDKDCLFEVHCHRCKAEMTLSAHIEKNLNDTAKTYNKSSQILHDNVVEEGVTEFDVMSIRSELQNFCGSFIQAFRA